MVKEKHTCGFCNKEIPLSQIYCRECYALYSDGKYINEVDEEGNTIPLALHQHEIEKLQYN